MDPGARAGASAHAGARAGGPRASAGGPAGAAEHRRGPAGGGPAAGAGARAARRLLARARAAAALPSLQGEYDQTIDRDYQLDQAAGTADALTQDLGAGRGARVRATWDLGRLVFNPDELRAARAILDAAAERERVLVAVTQLYFERQQLLLEIALLPARDGQEAIGRRVRVAEIEAVLTGLTGLRF
ncbi:hypothetical protein [Nannocystis pusilla]|uniref:hypothetical protein n=1 Tax=Nannocystis pusilla TaxID=889268 RepID=UPI003B79B47C